MNVVLVSTYELGRQPFGLASAAAWLEREGCSVRMLDLSVDAASPEPFAGVELIAFHLPMHTATRIAAGLIAQVRTINPAAHLCVFGLYAPINETYLRSLGAQTVCGGEFEPGLVALVRRLRSAGDAAPVVRHESAISLERLQFLVPRRDGLPALERYAKLVDGTGEDKTVAYTEASRGCKHRCRHCPVVPVYDGRFRIVQPEIVLADIRQQVSRGARHVTFGDPDFFNGPAHAVRIVRALHAEYPRLTYDVTIKIEHLLKHREHLSVLEQTGCLFVVSAVESIDDTICGYLDKRHTRADFIEAVGLMREHGLALHPTFVTFTPWTTLAGYADLVEQIAELDLVDHVAPVQYAIRLLVTASSKLLELDAMRSFTGAFDSEKLVYPWHHPDPRVDRLFETVLAVVREGQECNASRRQIWHRVWNAASAAAGTDAVLRRRVAASSQAPPRATVPYLTEPWYC